MRWIKSKSIAENIIRPLASKLQETGALTVLGGVAEVRAPLTPA